MRIIKPKTLQNFWKKHPDAERPLRAWLEISQLANWGSPSEVKADYRSASIVANNRIVFNIKGNDYRLVVKFHYNTKIGYIRFIGTHRDYDKINVTEV
ncbi:MAG: type II toxin-antitoxin system HigB family toxin [Chloroflexota bacterium]